MSQVSNLDPVQVVKRLSYLHHKMIRDGLSLEEANEKKELFNLYHDNEILFMDSLLKRLNSAENVKKSLLGIMRDGSGNLEDHVCYIAFNLEPKPEDSFLRKGFAAFQTHELYKRYVSSKPFPPMAGETVEKVVSYEMFEVAITHLLGLAKDEPDGFGSFVEDEFQSDEVLEARKFLDSIQVEWRNLELRSVK
jgi:hypothetical protein